MDGEHTGQVALVTGGTGGLGKVVTAASIEAGALVTVSYRNPDEKDALEAAGPHGSAKPAFAQVDVRDAAAVAALVALMIETYGRIDILVHLVGGYMGGKDVQDTSPEEWQGMIDLNLTTAFICCRAVLPSMRERGYGRIIAVSSRAAVRYSPGAAAYTAAKAGLLALVGSIAEENINTGVTANAVLPSIIDTPANRAAMPKAKHERWPKPEEIAVVIRFLAGPDSGLISGAAIPVYGRA